MIDASDIVVRLNAAPRPAAVSHGTRADWLAVSTALCPEKMAELAPSRLLWLTPRRKRLAWSMATMKGFYLSPVAAQKSLMETLGARPTTGLMMIDLLRKSRAREVHVFGFDFFNSLSLSGTRLAKDVAHDFEKEHLWFDALLEADDRFIYHPTHA